MKVIIEDTDSGRFPVTFEDEETSESRDMLPYEVIATLVNFMNSMMENIDQEQ